MQHPLQTLLDTPLKHPSFLQPSASPPFVPNHFCKGSMEENRVFCQQAEVFAHSDLSRGTTMPSSCWVPTSYCPLSHGLTEPVLRRAPAVAFVGLFGKQCQWVRNQKLASSAFQEDHLMAILSQFRLNWWKMNKRLPLIGQNWCNEASHCTPRDPTKAKAQLKGFSKQNLLNTML